jgi:hypothetical protein
MQAPAHLDHLRRDSRGRPVPWINLWGAEDTARMSIRPDPHCAGQPAVYLDDSQETEPDFTRQNMQRQREAVARGLCQVCGRRFGWPKLLIWSSISVRTVDVDGTACVVIAEPWLDTQCADFALSKCPGLIRRRTAKDIQLVIIDSIDQVKLTISNGWIDGPLEAESRRLLPCMWAKIIVGRG